MPKRGENIYQRKDGRWEGRYLKSRKDGKRKLGYVFAPTYADARKKLADARTTWQEGCDEREHKKMLLSSVIQSWMEDSVNALKESTLSTYRNYLNCYILPKFGDISIGAISTENIQAFLDALLIRGGADEQGLSPCTVAEIRCVLKILRGYAVRYGYDVSFSVDELKVKTKKPQIRVFSTQETERLRSYLSNNLTLCHMGILLCLSTGIRIGELCALRWENISLGNRELRVRETMQRVRNWSSVDGARTKVVVTKPKSDSSMRSIPLSEKICAQLRPFRESNGYFLTGEADRYIEPRQMQKKFKRVLEDCGIEPANFHALRHTFATRCIEAGFDVKCLSVILGHSSVNMTLNRYVHPSMDLMRRNMAKMP